MLAKKGNLVVGLDIGTTKIAAIVAEVTEDGVDIIGVGSSPSRGMQKGVVVNIDKTVGAIKKAVEEAELMAGCEIKSVYVGIAGNHIKGVNSRGVVAIKDREVSHDDIKRVIDAARAIAIPMDREVIHILPQEFIVDDQDGIREPLGMSGVRLETKVHIVTGAMTSAQNIIKSCNRAGLEVADIVLEPVASSEAVLSPDEKELGVALIDIGGGTTDLAIFIDGAIKHTAVLPLGGNHLTNDIAIGLRTSMQEAERIKRAYGCCLSEMVESEETIQVPDVGGRKPRQLSKKLLCDILEPRVEEIFLLVQQELVKFGCQDLLAGGVVLTGGTTILPGMVELSEQVFRLPVRRGSPTKIGGLTDIIASPMYATGVGLTLYGSKNSVIDSGSSSRRDGEGLFTRLKTAFKKIVATIVEAI